MATTINEIDKLRLQPTAPIERSDKLDKDAFLKIFLAQLDSQDPLAPKDSADLSAQLAQFSQLEQSVNATEQLTQIGAKLDSLIELTRDGGSTALDPVTLIGRRIEFAQNELRVSASGTSDELRADLSTERNALTIGVEDPETGAQGLFSIAAGGDGNTPVPLGTYRLRFVDGQPVLVGPGASGRIEFIRLRERDGQLVEERDAEGQPARFSFAPNHRYRFSVQALDLSGAAEPVEITPTQTGIADSVRFVDGKPRIALGTTEIGPEQIRRILDASR